MLHHLISTYGYGAVLILTFLEGEAILVLAGVAAHRGYLELHWVMAAAFVGTFLGDQLYFYIGCRFGPRLLERRQSWRRASERVSQMLQRHETLLILTFRFLYGLRTVASFAFGIAGISRSRFLVLNALGALLWSVAIAWGGYWFGSLFQRYVDVLQRYELEILAGFVALTGLVVLVRWLRYRRRSKPLP